MMEELDYLIGYTNDEKSILFGICMWLKTTDEYKNIEITNDESIFYHTSLLTYAKMIFKYQQSFQKECSENNGYYNPFYVDNDAYVKHFKNNDSINIHKIINHEK